MLGTWTGHLLSHQATIPGTRLLSSPMFRPSQFLCPSFCPCCWAIFSPPKVLPFPDPSSYPSSPWTIPGQLVWRPTDVLPPKRLAFLLLLCTAPISPDCRMHALFSNGFMCASPKSPDGEWGWDGGRGGDWPSLCSSLGFSVPVSERRRWSQRPGSPPPPPHLHLDPLVYGLGALVFRKNK